jgi:hypothetical protein
MPDLIRDPEALEKDWIPAFAGMTAFYENRKLWTNSE